MRLRWNLLWSLFVVLLVSGGVLLFTVWTYEGQGHINQSQRRTKDTDGVFEVWHQVDNGKILLIFCQIRLI